MIELTREEKAPFSTPENPPACAETPASLNVRTQADCVSRRRESTLSYSSMGDCSVVSTHWPRFPATTHPGPREIYGLSVCVFWALWCHSKTNINSFQITRYSSLHSLIRTRLAYVYTWSSNILTFPLPFSFLKTDFFIAPKCGPHFEYFFKFMYWQLYSILIIRYIILNHVLIIIIVR